MSVNTALILAGRRQRNTRLRCDCLGYWFPHRVTGGACEHGPRADYFHAIRQGATRSEAEALLWSHQLDKLPAPLKESTA